MANNRSKFGAALSAFGAGLATGNFGNVGRDMNRTMDRNTARQNFTQQQKMQEQRRNHTADWLQAKGANENTVALARNGGGARAMQIYQFEQKAQQPQKREFTKDINGQNRYLDNQEPVFSNVAPQQAAPKLTNQQTNDLGSSQAAIKSLESELNSYTDLVQKHGNEYLPGVARDAIATKRRNIQMQMKELFNLGVLSGPDLDLMDQMVYDAAPSGWLDTPAAMVREGASAIGFGDTPEDRARANANQLKTQFKDMLNAKRRAFGVQPPAKFGDNNQIAPQQGGWTDLGGGIKIRELN